MAKPEWGTKRICQACGNKFYDLLRSPISCPSCGAEYDPEALLRSRRTRSSIPKDDAKKKVVAAKAEDSGIEEAFDADLDDAELDDEVSKDEESVEDASELGEDDDLGDVGDVKRKDGDES